MPREPSNKKTRTSPTTSNKPTSKPALKAKTVSKASKASKNKREAKNQEEKRTSIQRQKTNEPCVILENETENPEQVSLPQETAVPIQQLQEATVGNQSATTSKLSVNSSENQEQVPKRSNYGYSYKESQESYMIHNLVKTSPSPVSQPINHNNGEQEVTTMYPSDEDEYNENKKSDRFIRTSHDDFDASFFFDTEDNIMWYGEPRIDDWFDSDGCEHEVPYTEKQFPKFPIVYFTAAQLLSKTQADRELSPHEIVE